MSEAIPGIAGSSGAVQMPVPVTSGGNETTKAALSQNSAASNVLSASMDQKGTYSSLSTGAANILPTSTTAKVAIEINSVSGDVLSSMKKLPAPVDLTAVTQVRDEIRAGTYIYDSSKVVAALQKAYEDMV